jgi:hypothetical protein
VTHCVKSSVASVHALRHALHLHERPIGGCRSPECGEMLPIAMKIRLNREAAHRESQDAPDQPGSGRLNPRFVRLTAAGCLLLVLAGILTVRQLQSPATPSGTVVFKGARVLLCPGEGWKAVESGGYTLVRNICLPALEGEGRFKGGTIEVLASPNYPKDPQIMATNLVKGLQVEPNVMKDTIRTDDFITESGMRGIHIGCRIVIRDEDRQGEAIAHSYIVRNMRGDCVRLNYTTVPGHDWEAVHQMILRTLAPW